MVLTCACTFGCFNLQVNFSGNKWKDKKYRWHTGYPGGLKERTAETMLERNPTKILRKAVRGMLMGRRERLQHKYVEPRLKIYTGDAHPHTAQLPAGVEPLPPVPRKLTNGFHFGLKYYAHPLSYQPNRGGSTQQTRTEINTDSNGSV